VLDVDGESGDTSLRSLVEQRGDEWTRTCLQVVKTVIAFIEGLLQQTNRRFILSRPRIQDRKPIRR
jgi:hypothetical protein